MAAFVNRCQFVATSAGTGTFTVAKAAVGYMTPSQAGAINGTTYSYAAQTLASNGSINAWEVGTGVYTATSTFTRSPLFSSNANHLVNFATAPNVMLTPLAADLPGTPGATGPQGPVGPQGPQGIPGAGADLGLTNVKNFGAIGDGIANDTAAIQAAMDSGVGNPINVFFPPGTYKVAPPNVAGACCLVVHYDNVTMSGAGPLQSIVKCYVSGGRDPNISFDATEVGYGQAVWRGSGIFIHGEPSDCGARATTSASTGKLYFEWSIDAIGATLGLSNASSFSVKDSQNGLAYQFLGALKSASVFGSVGSGPIFINSVSPVANLGVGTSPGDVFAIAADLNFKLLWAKNITKNSAWNGNGAANPATGVGGLDISSIPLPISPTADMESGGQVTLNLGASAYAGAVPAGFFNWPGGGGFNPNDIDQYRVVLSNNNLTARRVISGPADGARNNIVVTNLRVTGQCLRSTGTWPFGGADPPFQPGLVGVNADGWDLTHHGVKIDFFAAHDNIQINNCEVDGWKGEMINGGTGFTNLKIQNNVLHDCNADIVSIQAGPTFITNNIIHDGTNIIENSPFNQDMIVEDNYCYNFTEGFVVTNQTTGGGDAALNGITIIRNNFVRNSVTTGIFIQSFAKQVWVRDNTFIDCGHNVAAMNLQPFNAAPTTTYTGMNIVIEDNQIISYLLGIGGINVTINGTTTPVTQIFIRRNTFLVTPASISTPGSGIGWGVKFTLAAGCVIFVEDNDCEAVGAPAFMDNLPGVGQAVFRRNVLPLGLPNPDRVMLYTQFNKLNDSTLAAAGMTTALGVAGIYTFTARLFVSANASGGAKVGVVFSGVAHEFFASAKLYTGTTLSASGSSSTNGAVLAGATAAIDSIEITGYIVASKVMAEAGSLDVSFAQNAPFGTQSSVLKGSFLSVCESQYQAAYP